MTPRDLLEQVAIWTNVILWGGVGAFLITVSFTDPIAPEEIRQAEKPAESPQGDTDVTAAPRHRA